MTSAIPASTQAPYQLEQKEIAFLESGNLFEIVQAFDTPAKLEGACDYFLKNQKLITTQKRVALFIYDLYFKSIDSNTTPLRKFYDLSLICRTQPRYANCQERLKTEEAEKLFDKRFQEVVEKTALLLKSKVSLETIFAYVAEERYRTAERSGHPEADKFGTPRQENLITRISLDVDEGKMPREYQERLFCLVPEGAKQRVISYPYYYQNVDQVAEQLPIGAKSTLAIPLTLFCVTRYHIAKFEAEIFDGSEAKSPYPRATLVHTKPEQFSTITHHTYSLIKMIREKSLPKNELVETIGTAGFYEFKATRWKRGSATIIETMLASLCEHSGLHLRLDRLKKDGKRLDLEALTLLDPKAFTKFFAGYVEEKASAPETVSQKLACE